MTVEAAFLSRIVAALDGAGISYMVAGSLASSFRGRYRSTNDADIVIDATSEQLDSFLTSLGEELYFDRETAQAALRDRSMFNVIEFTTGSKADLIIRKERPFSREEFNRRQSLDVLGRRIWAATAEDVILSKLEWSKMGESERQFQDALGVALVQFGRLDWPYLRKWAVELDVAPLLDRLAAEAAVVEGGEIP